MASRESIIPTKAMVQNLKARKQAAVRGHALLKKKVDALNSHYRRLQHEIKERKLEMLEAIKDSYWSIAIAQRSVSTDLSTFLEQSVTKLPSSYVNYSVENTAGVCLPNLELVTAEDQQVLQQIGGGAQALKNASEKWKECLRQMVRVASMQQCYVALEEVILQTNRRVNALEYVLIPNLEENIKYIEEVLEEEERESFFKMKMVSNKKAREAEEQGIDLGEIDEGRKTGLAQNVVEGEAAADDADNLF